MKQHPILDVPVVDELDSLFFAYMGRLPTEDDLKTMDAGIRAELRRMNDEQATE